MNTNNIKSFAKQARLILIEGVKQRLLFWGFDESGNCTTELTATVGGYDFRAGIYTDESVPPKWNKLKAKLVNKQAVQDTIEEAAYTWFNRIMAIKILEKRGYIPLALDYVPDLKTPQIVQEAKRGQHQLKQQKYVNLLQEYLLEDKEEQALGLLLTRLCNNNTVIHDVFGRIDDYTEILLPTNLLARNGIIDLLNSDALEESQYQEVELIGWLYQFYISDKKDEVFKGFKANKKARPEDIPAATQIFTPKWIVKYMVENTVGKIYLDYDKNSDLKSEMKYLVEASDNNQGLKVNEASGVNDQGLNVNEKKGNLTINNLPLTIDNSSLTINNLEELTLIDPASGSGHILVTGFELLFKMYREQGYTAKNAVISILQNNIYGLDIDDRAMQLARFAVLLKAAEFYPEILKASDSNSLVLPHIYSFPTKHHFQLEDIHNFLSSKGGSFVGGLKENLLLLNEGKNIGAALKLELSAEAHTFISNQFQNWNTQYQTGTLDILQQDLWNNLKPFLEVLLVMTKKYTAVVANPPYMGQKSMNGPLKEYINGHYPDTKSDLMTVFMEVIPNMTLDNSRFALINLPSWLFLSSFEKLRVSYIENYHFESLLHMGRGIFGIDFGSVAFTMKKEQKKDAVGNYFRLHERNFQHILFEDIEKLFLYANGNVNYKYDFNLYRGDEGITEIPEHGTENGQRLFYPNITQDNFEKIPGSPIAYWVSDVLIEKFKSKKIKNYAILFQGMITGNNNKFVREWHEISFLRIQLNLNKIAEYDVKNGYWVPYNKGGNTRKWYGNQEKLVNFSKKGKDFTRERSQFTDFYFKPCFSWSYITSGDIDTRFYQNGFIWDVHGSSAFAKKDEDLFYLMSLVSSRVGSKILKILNPTLSFQVENIAAVPSIFPNSSLTSEVITLTKENINNSKKDWDFHETSWDFEQSPLLNESVSLKESYQKWQGSVTQDFFQLHKNEEELNRIFIDIYGLQEELTPEVALKDITILQEELDKGELLMVNDQLIAGYKQWKTVVKDQGLRVNEKEEKLTINNSQLDINNYPLNINHYCSLPIKKDEVISQFLSYSIGVFMGRYRLDKPGLHIAHPNPSEEEVAPYVIAPAFCNSDEKRNLIHHSPLTITIDDDAIIPIMGSECAFPDDALVRIKNLVHNLWGEETLTENLNFINECLGIDLDKWLTDKFWGYHTSMYKKKPIYWLFTSNPKKPQAAAFKVLVYMHRMDKYTVSKIQRTYLHPHQEWIKHEIEKLLIDEANLSKTEIKRLEKLRTWEIECRDYNEVLKTLALEVDKITFDLDDGVTVNYEKFEGAVAKI